jgi:hypothetical protein
MPYEILVRLPENLNVSPTVVEVDNYTDIQHIVGGGNFDVSRFEWEGEEVDLFMYDDIGVENMLPNHYCRYLFDANVKGVVLLGGGADHLGVTRPVGPKLMTHIMRSIHHRNNTPSNGSPFYE